MLISITRYYIKWGIIIKNIHHDFWFSNHSRGISCTDGARIYAQPVKFWKNPVLQIFFKTWYSRNLKLGMMCKITQLWPLSPLLLLLCQISRQDLRNFFAQKRNHISSTYLSGNIGYSTPLDNLSPKARI